MQIPKEINSRFKFVVIAARRAVQLQRGAKPKLSMPSTKWTRVAVKEVENNLIPYKDVAPLAGPAPTKKSKKSKD